MTRPFLFGSVRVPGAAARHARVLVLDPDESEVARILEALAAAGHIASGLGDAALARDVLVAIPFDVVLADRGLARRMWGPLLGAVADRRTRLVLVAPDGAPSPSTVDGVRTIQRPILIQQLLGVVSEAIASRARLAETEPQLVGAELVETPRAS